MKDLKIQSKMRIKKYTKFMTLAGMMALVVPLSGCTGEFFALESVSAAVFDKTASDHLVSLVSGKDCSFLRVEQDKSYCVEDARILQQSHLYCYPTLGAVTCYTEPDPRRSPSERIGYLDAADPIQ